MKKLSSISLALLSMLSFSALADTANLEDLEKACNASDGTACESIAKAYELGTNVETNFDKANICYCSLKVA